MASHILSIGSRFNYSQDFHNIALKHVIQWIDDEDSLEFILRGVKHAAGAYDHI